MKTKSIFKLTTLCLLLFLAWSCKKDIELIDTDNKNSVSASKLSLLNTDGSMVLGVKLKNPYSVENMTEAKNNLLAIGELNSTEFIVRTTHKYIKFIPETEEELDILEDDTTLILYDYPLDYQIIQGGVYYRDPTVPSDRPTFQYVSVEVNHPLPSVRHEVLDNLYIPEEVEDIKDSISIDKLVDEALRITNNLIDLDGMPVQGISFKRPSKWNPNGRIRIYDDAVGSLIPLEGAKIRARRWFTTKEVYTNSQGYFQTGSFRREVNYSIKWERNDYDIRSGTFGQAILNGPKKKGTWYKDVNDGIQKFYGHIHRGAFDYFYNHSSLGISSPPKNSTWRPKLKIGAYDKDKDFNGVAHPWTRPLGIWNVIRIYNPDRASDLTYGTTVHEVGHYAHWGIDKSNYNNGEDRVAESWAEGIEWAFATWRYNLLISSGYTYQSNYQNRTTTGSPVYTSVVVDLIDNNNQRANNRNFSDLCPCDGSYDSQNCFIATAPNNTTAFIYGSSNNGNFYYTPVNGNQCPLSGSYFDGANCFVQNIPNGCIPFINNNSFYIQRNGHSQWPLDAVSGYSIGEIENALNGSGDFSEWEKNIRDKFSNNTEKYLDELFGSWN